MKNLQERFSDKLIKRGIEKSDYGGYSLRYNFDNYHEVIKTKKVRLEKTGREIEVIEAKNGKLIHLNGLSEKIIDEFREASRNY